MGRLRAGLIRLRSLFHKRRREREMAEELQSHLEMNIEENLRSGMTSEEARRQALIKLGGLEQVKEECREAWSVRFLEELIQDLRYGLRQLRRNPGFTVIAVLMLALGIGVNSAIFSMVSAVYLTSPYVRDPSHVVVISSRPPRENGSAPVSGGDFVDWRSQNNVFTGLAASAAAEGVDMVIHGEPVNVSGMTITRNYFQVLGLAPALGRNFVTGKEEDGGDYEVILSDGLWREYFGADPQVIGSAVTINGKSFTVIGVMPRRAILWAGLRL